MFTIENFIDGLQNTFSNIQVITSEDNILISRGTRNGDNTLEQCELLGKIPLGEVQVAIDKFVIEPTFNDFILYQKVNFEIPIKPQDRMRI